MEASPLSGHQSLDGPTQMRLAELMADDLGARYEVERFIGRGGLATVWRALDGVTGEAVAIKRLDPERERGGDFYRELSLLFRLVSPRIAQLRTIVEGASGSRYLVLELCEGGSLRAVMNRMRRRGEACAPPEAARGLAAEVAAALAVAHALGVVHRDLKPENILVPTAGVARWEAIGPIKLTDFGLARGRGERARVRDGRLGPLSGSPAYMSPEQFSDAYSERSDIYALGVLCYELLHGELPFRGDTKAVIHAHIHAQPAIDSALPAPWPELLPRLLSKDPQVRPDAEALAAELSAAAPASRPRIERARRGSAPEATLRTGRRFELLARLPVPGRALGLRPSVGGGFVAFSDAGAFAVELGQDPRLELLCGPLPDLVACQVDAEGMVLARRDRIQRRSPGGELLAEARLDAPVDDVVALPDGRIAWLGAGVLRLGELGGPVDWERRQPPCGLRGRLTVDLEGRLWVTHGTLEGAASAWSADGELVDERRLGGLVLAIEAHPAGGVVVDVVGAAGLERAWLGPEGELRLRGELAQSVQGAGLCALARGGQLLRLAPGASQVEAFAAPARLSGAFELAEQGGALAALCHDDRSIWAWEARDDG